MSNEITMVLLHGAGMGAWVWERVMSELSSPCVALDIPGRKAGASPEQRAEELVRELERRNVGAVIPVMHSLAGVLAPGTTYIKLLNDRSIVPAQQDGMLGRLHQPVVRELTAGHLAMLSAPAALAKLIQGEVESNA